MTRRVLLLVVVAVSVLAACGSPAETAAETTTAPAGSVRPTTSQPPATPPPGGTASTTFGPSPTESATGAVPDRLAHLPTATITVQGAPWLVAVADTAQARRTGLMFVTDLGGLDGMLFVFPSATDGGFWMKDTLIPLDIAFFSEDGLLVDVLQMDPCPQGADCPSYRPSGPYLYALEAPQGSLVGLASDASLTLP